MTGGAAFVRRSAEHIRSATPAWRLAAARSTGKVRFEIRTEAPIDRFGECNYTLILGSDLSKAIFLSTTIPAPTNSGRIIPEVRFSTRSQSSVAFDEEIVPILSWALSAGLA